jgi:hypothetical protein
MGRMALNTHLAVHAMQTLSMQAVKAARAQGSAAAHRLERPKEDLQFRRMSLHPGQHRVSLRARSDSAEDVGRHDSSNGLKMQSTML